MADALEDLTIAMFKHACPTESEIPKYDEYGDEEEFSEAEWYFLLGKEDPTAFRSILLSMIEVAKKSS
jgi:hypothetical protein